MKKNGRTFVILGLACIAAALGLTGYNLWDEARAEKASAAVTAQLQQEIVRQDPTNQAADAKPINPSEIEIPDYLLNPHMEMPTQTVDGVGYIGLLTVPAIDLELPVITDWSYSKLKIAPCRFSGSVYLDNAVIAAHNYTGHFRRLKTLEPGDAVLFTDVDGNVFRYVVAAMEILQPEAIEDMVAGEWPLTLFTCTVGGQSRITIRCEKTEE